MHQLRVPAAHPASPAAAVLVASLTAASVWKPCLCLCFGVTLLFAQRGGCQNAGFGWDLKRITKSDGIRGDSGLDDSHDRSG